MIFDKGMEGDNDDNVLDGSLQIKPQKYKDATEAFSVNFVMFI